jgi:hypothetical protein
MSGTNRQGKFTTGRGKEGMFGFVDPLGSGGMAFVEGKGAFIHWKGVQTQVWYRIDNAGLLGLRLLMFEETHLPSLFGYFEPTRA